MSFADRHLRYRLIDDAGALRDLEQTLERRRREGALKQVAVDFEFSGFSDLSLRLLQLGLGGYAHFAPEQLLLDAAKIDIRSLGTLFEDETVAKVVHAPHSDYRRWFEYSGATSDAAAEGLAFRNVYDTAQRIGLIYRGLRTIGDERAEQVLAWTGKQELRRNYYGYAVPLGVVAENALGAKWSDKRTHRSDRWMVEVLPAHQLEAAALDVAALGPLRTLLEPLEQELTAKGIDIAAEAQVLDRRSFELARDWALVPPSRRDELRALVFQLADEATQGVGERELPELTPAESRVLRSEFKGARSPSKNQAFTAEIVEQEGRLVVRALTRDRRRELAILAEDIGQRRTSMPELLPLEERMVSRYLEKRYPDVMPQMERI